MTPTNLYRRGAIYYWRRALPARLTAPLGGAVRNGPDPSRNRPVPDLRLSLRTHLLATARRRAQRLGAVADELFAALEESMRETPLTPAQITAMIVPLLRDALDQAECARATAGPRTAADAEARAARHEAEAERLRAALVTNDLAAAAAVLARVGAPHQPAPGTPAHAVACRHLMRGLIQVEKTNAARERGDYGADAVQFDLSPAAPHAPMPAAASPAAMATSPLAYSEAPRTALLFADRLFRDAYDVFIEANTGAPWRSETVRDARNARDYFIELIGNKRVGDITHEDALDFRKKLARIPALIGRSIFREWEIGSDGRPVLDRRGRPKYRRMAAPEAIARADRMDAERTADIERRLAAGRIDPDNLEEVKRRELVPRLAPKTVNKHLDLTSQLFKWIDTERHQPIRNPFYKTRLKVEGDPRDERPMLSRAQIRALFASPAWTGCFSASRRARPGRTIIKDVYYWIPLLCAHASRKWRSCARRTCSRSARCGA